MSNSGSNALGKNYFTQISNDTLQVINPDGEIKPITVFKNKLSAFTTDSTDKRIFVSSEDNDLTVLKYGDSGKAKIENVIPMGGLVTALNYNTDSDIIFFGLKTGEIGYIRYANKEKSEYQPVYETSWIQK